VPTIVTHVDHSTSSISHYDEAVLFYSSVLGLEAQAALEVAGPVGLVTSQVIRSRDGRIGWP
jgi:4-hydroxyphenylpyruvate dioxygenase